MGMSIKEAVIASGVEVKESTAKNWERDIPELRKRIAQLSEIADKNAILKTGLDREWVIDRLMKVVDRCMQAEEVLDRKGEPTGQYKFDSSGANGALKMLGDTLGMFRQQEKDPGDEYANITDDDIARIASEIAAQVGILEAPTGTETPAGSQQAVPLQAVPEAGGVPQLGERETGEVVSSGEPVGQDLVERIRNRVPSHRPVSGLVEGQTLE